MPENNAAISIERLGKNNISDLAILYFSVYERKQPQSFFEKKYDTAYTGVQYLGYIAYTANRIPIAFYGVVPCYVCNDGETMLAAQSADTMTHPAFRNKGLFVKLAEMTVFLCKDHKIELLFGFPNQNSLPVFINKLGWKVSMQMDCFSIPVYTKPIQKLLRKILVRMNFHEQYQKNIILKHAHGITEMPYAFFANQDPGVWRNDAYMEYRDYNTHWFVTFHNAFAWIRITDQLVIGDMEVAEKDFETMIETLSVVALKLGLKKIVFHCTKTSRLHALFAKRCIAIHSFPVIFKEIGTVQDLSRYSFTYADVDTF